VCIGEQRLIGRSIAASTKYFSTGKTGINGGEALGRCPAILPVLAR
jgi:hypothetical protein